jgi:hypothetical protein
LSTPTPLPRRAAGILALAVTAVLVAACGSGSSSGPSGSAGSGTTGEGAPNLAFRMNAVVGKVASVGSAGAKVTTSKGVSDVAFGSVTRFTRVTTVARSAVGVGDCVSATSKARRDASNTPSASVVTVTGTSSCAATRSGGGFSGGRPGGTPPSAGLGGTAAPDGSTPTAPPSSGGFSGGRPGQPGNRAGSFGGTVGTVTSVSGSTIVVKPVFGGNGNVSVHTTSATSFRAQQTAAASDVAVGRCLTAVGRTSGTVVDAFSVTISSPVHGRCTAVVGGFGGFGGAGRAPGGAAPPESSGASSDA